MEENINKEPQLPSDEPGHTPAPEIPEPHQVKTGNHQHKLKKFVGKLVSNKKLLAVALIIIFLLAGGAVYWLVIKSNNAVSSSGQAQNKSNTSSGASSTKVQLAPAILVNGNSYFDIAKPLSDLKFFKNADALPETDMKLSDVAYYQIGTTKDGRKIIIAVIPGGIGTMNWFALGNSDGTYDVLAQMDSNIANYQDNYKKSLSDNVRIDSTIGLNDAAFPSEATINNQKLKSNWDSPAMSNSNFMTNGLISVRGTFHGELKTGTPQKIATKDGLNYYRIITKDENAFQVVEIYATFSQLFSASYKPAGEIASTTGNLSVSWSGGENNTSSYFSGGQGCGTSGYVIAKNLNKSDLIVAGKSPQKQNLYQLPVDNALVQDIYDKDYAKGENLDDASLKNLTIQQMTDKHGYFLAENGFGEFVVFQRSDLFMRGGCAKPVIYLYPQQTTNVSLQIGADVTKSEPGYPEGGWQNVIAEPSGRLQYKGSSYSSLFWEGYGYGPYPEIGSGTIVRSTDAASTIRHQLAQQGLNQTETNDFMDFWSSKLPTDKPYTRITWFSTAQLNRLAPLHVTPSPQTTIRVFMDFEELDKPYNLAPQNFSAPKRSGFTLVEWGGLARNGLDN